MLPNTIYPGCHGCSSIFCDSKVMVISASQGDIWLLRTSPWCISACHANVSESRGMSRSSSSMRWSDFGPCSSIFFVIAHWPGPTSTMISSRIWQLETIVSMMPWLMRKFCPSDFFACTIIESKEYWVFASQNQYKHHVLLVRVCWHCHYWFGHMAHFG